MGKECHVLVAASGSGGHLYPARLIIEALLDIQGVSVSFVGSGRPLEETIIGPTGVPLHAISCAGLKNRGLKGVVEFVVSLPKGLFQCLKIFSQYKPDVVIGVGGYATFLPVTLAFLRRLPRWIHEAERNPGLANFVLSHYATRVSLAFPDTKMAKRAQTILHGHPLRKALRAVVEKEPGDVTSVDRILILGGSQGAKALDDVMCSLTDFLKKRHLAIWHQCRPENHEVVSAAYRKAHIDARVVSFIDDLHEAYQWCHMIISRSGAGAVMEAGVVNKPVIFVPFPYAQGDHQTANANILVEQGKAVLVAEGEKFKERLEAEIDRLLEPKVYAEMQNLPSKYRKLDAADVIAREAVALTG